MGLASDSPGYAAESSDRRGERRQESARRASFRDETASCTLIHDRYEYRYVTTPDGAAAFALEREVQRGALNAGKPFLNPA